MNQSHPSKENNVLYPSYSLIEDMILRAKMKSTNGTIPYFKYNDELEPVVE